MTGRKTAPVARFRLWLRTFIQSRSIRRKQDRVRYIRPSLEALEDRTLLSAPVNNPLPVVSEALHPPEPSITAVMSYLANRVDQGNNLVAIVQQDVIGFGKSLGQEIAQAWASPAANLRKAIGQEVAQVVSFVEQQWDRLFGVDPNTQDSAYATALTLPSSNYSAGRGNSSGSGRGSGSTTSAHNIPDPASNPTGQNSGSGSGSGHSSSSVPTGTSPTAGVKPMSGSGGSGGCATRDLTGFTTNTLPANDDDSTGLVNLGFTIDFGGKSYSSLYVNNNGNVTFGAPMSTYTPESLVNVGQPIIAPFWADVDTRGDGNLVSYGTDTVDGHAAFGVDWFNVNY